MVGRAEGIETFRKRLEPEIRGVEVNFSEIEKEEFFNAIRAGNHEVVEVFLRRGLSPNIANRSNESALEYAALQGDDACTALLLTYRADKTNLPMDAAAVTDNPAVMERFISVGGDPNAVSKYGGTPLMEAANWGNANIVRVLLEHGADISRRTDNGYTAADAARKYGHIHLLPLLEPVEPPKA